MKKALWFVGALIALGFLGLGATALSAAYPPGLGGTGSTVSPLPGQVLIGNSGNNYTPAYILCAGTCQVATSSGGITITGTGIANNAGNWAGTWQLYNPSDFLSSSTQIVNTVNGLSGVVTISSSSLGVVWPTVNGNKSASYQIVAGTGATSTVSGATTTISVSLNNGATQTCSANQFINSLTASGTVNCGSITFPTAATYTFSAGTGVLLSQATSSSNTTTTITNTGVTSFTGQGCVTAANSTGSVSLAVSCISGNQSILFTITGDATGTASGSTAITDSITVTGLNGKVLPANTTGTLQYSAGAWAINLATSSLGVYSSSGVLSSYIGSSCSGGQYVTGFSASGTVACGTAVATTTPFITGGIVTVSSSGKLSTVPSSTYLQSANNLLDVSSPTSSVLNLNIPQFQFETSTADGSLVERLEHSFVNFLLNGNFATWNSGTNTYPTGWTGQNATVNQTTTTSIGSFSALLTTSSTDGNMYQAITDNANVWYTCSGWYRYVSGNATDSLSIQENSGSFTQLATSLLTNSNSGSYWNLAMVSAMQPADGNTSLRCKWAQNSGTQVTTTTFDVSETQMQEGENLATAFVNNIGDYGYITTSTNNFGAITNASVTANSPIVWSSTSTITCPTCSTVSTSTANTWSAVQTTNGVSNTGNVTSTSFTAGTSTPTSIQNFDATLNVPSPYVSSTYGDFGTYVTNWYNARVALGDHAVAVNIPVTGIPVNAWANEIVASATATSIVINCPAQALVNWSGTNTSTYMNPGTAANETFASGWVGCYPDGNGRTQQTFVQFGGTNGAYKPTVQNNTVYNFNQGVVMGSNAPFPNISNNQFEFVTQPIYANYASTTNAGENNYITDNIFGGCEVNNVLGVGASSSIYIVNGAGVTGSSNSLDDCDNYVGAGTTEVWSGGWNENPGNVTTHYAGVPVFDVATSTTNNLTLISPSFMTDVSGSQTSTATGASSTPPYWIADSGQLTILGGTAQANVTASSVLSLVNVSTAGYISIQGFLNVSNASSALGVTNLIGTANGSYTGAAAAGLLSLDTTNGGYAWGQVLNGNTYEQVFANGSYMSSDVPGGGNNGTIRTAIGGGTVPGQESSTLQVYGSVSSTLIIGAIGHIGCLELGLSGGMEYNYGSSTTPFLISTTTKPASGICQ